MSTPLVTTSSSSLALFIPHEIVGEILSHCDPSTLAVASRVSSACLELASPFLYTDIVVKDTQSVVKLFRLSHSFGDALPKSDRVTSLTSLSLIHSITVVLETIPVDFGPLRELELPPPLALAVSVVSTPGPNSSISSRVYDLSQVVQLVNPRTFVVRGRQPKLDSTHFRPAIVKLAQAEESATPRNWDRLEIAILHGASVNLWDLIDSRTSQVRHESDPPLPPLRIVDPISAPEKSFTFAEHAGHFVDRNLSVLSSARVKVSLKAWVESEEVKKTLEEKMKASEQFLVWPPRGKHADVEVITDRVHRFRDDLALGAWKVMDWAVLEEV